MIIIVLASAAFWLSWFFVCTKAVWTFHTPEKNEGHIWTIMKQHDTKTKKKHSCWCCKKKLKKKKKEKRITHEMFKSFDVLDCAQYAYQKKEIR